MGLGAVLRPLAVGDPGRLGARPRSAGSCLDARSHVALTVVGGWGDSWGSHCPLNPEPRGSSPSDLLLVGDLSGVP